MKQIIEQVKEIKEKRRLTNRDIAKQAGFSEQILSALFRDKYTGDSASYIEMLRKWVNARTEKEAQQELPSGLKEPEFVMLPTTKNIMGIMQVAQSLKRVAMAYEGSGVGKTEAAREYQRQHPNVWIVTVSEFARTSMAVVDELARLVGIDVQGMTLARKNEHLIKALDGAHGLIVIDEAQYLSDNTLNGLRILAEGRAGITLLGNDMVHSRMQATRSIINLRPIWSRTIRPMRIEKTTGRDIEVYMAAWGITDKEMVNLAKQIVPRTNGQIRTLGDAIKLGSSLADKSQEVFGVKHFNTAFGYLTESIK
ncbi:AAA family ATPase [Vibrio sp. OPT18]|uniref:AAA family ATPase n=1 Tax=Vibrio sp. OPT18 TaxID=2778641 RepID=UPI00187E7B00|nr:AAA family ATPase [Vibrio sp. OPT18]MBE8578611.1 AAA family ATPase [Vibrio sp. OPT18]